MATREDAFLVVLEDIALQLRRIALAVEKPELGHSECKRCGFSRLSRNNEKCPTCRAST